MQDKSVYTLRFDGSTLEVFVDGDLVDRTDVVAGDPDSVVAARGVVRTTPWIASPAGEQFAAGVPAEVVSAHRDMRIGRVRDFLRITRELLAEIGDERFRRADELLRAAAVALDRSA
jgi:hypothetical protein